MEKKKVFSASDWLRRQTFGSFRLNQGLTEETQRFSCWATVQQQTTIIALLVLGADRADPRSSEDSPTCAAVTSVEIEKPRGGGRGGQRVFFRSREQLNQK